MVTRPSQPRVSPWVARIAVLVLGALYGAGALVFFAHESLARAPARAENRPPSELRHPEAVLGMLRAHADGVYPNELRPALSRALELAPSFYQGPLFYADFLAQRREEPRAARALFELAIERFPTNGRIRIAYAEWLLAGRSDLAVIAALDTIDPLPLAEAQLHQALALEPERTAEALALLDGYRVRPERWRRVVPADRRRELALALRGAGHRELALDELRALPASTDGVDELSEAAGWALSWGAPALALELAAEVHDASAATRIRITSLRARAHWLLGEPDAAYEVFETALRNMDSRAGRLELSSAAGDAFLGRNELLVAESFYREALIEDGEFVPAVLGLARVHRRRNEPEAAIETYESVLRLDRDNERARRELDALLASP